MKNYTKHNNRRGMTLIELLISISISAVIGIMIAVTFSTAQQVVSVGVAGAHAFDSARIIEDSLRKDLKQFTNDGVLVIKTQTIQNADTGKLFEVDQLLFFTQGEYESWQHVNNNTANPLAMANNACVWYGHTLQKYDDPNDPLVPFYRFIEEGSNDKTGDPLQPAAFERTMTLGRQATLLTRTPANFSWRETLDNDTLNTWASAVANGHSSVPSDLEMKDLYQNDVVYTDINAIKNKIINDAVLAGRLRPNGFNGIPAFIQSLASRRHSRRDYDVDVSSIVAQKALLNTQLGVHCSRFKIEFWNDSNPSTPFWQRPTNLPSELSVTNDITTLMAGLGTESPEMTRSYNGYIGHVTYGSSNNQYNASRISLPKMLRFTITLHDEHGRLNKMHHETKEFEDPITKTTLRPGHTSDGRTVQFIVRIPRTNGRTSGSRFGGFGSASPNDGLKDAQPGDDLFGAKSTGGVPAGNF